MKGYLNTHSTSSLHHCAVNIWTNRSVSMQHSSEVPGHSVPAEGQRGRLEGAQLEGDGASVGLPGSDGSQHGASPLRPWRRHN